jgi:hypothetical protein
VKPTGQKTSHQDYRQTSRLEHLHSHLQQKEPKIIKHYQQIVGSLSGLAMFEIKGLMQRNKN